MDSTARRLLGRLFLLCSVWTLLGAIASPALADGAAATAPALAAAPVAIASALDYDLPDGHFFTQANGSPLGKSSTGFLLADDGGIGLWKGYEQLGGVGLLGYPISGRFLQAGFVAQATQRGILQWQPASSSVALANVFDQLHDAGKDAWLEATYQVPPPTTLPEKGLSFAQVTQQRLALLDANPAIKARYLATPDAVQVYGLPTSGPVDFGPLVALRAQRVVFQYWKVAEPWAKAGDVTLVNGGDVAKAAGIIPNSALAAEASPVIDGQAAAIPWSGWWWPASLQPYTPPYLFQANGALATYDAYVRAGGAPSPDTQGWERQHIVFNDPTLFWAGHCNGWAAAALLEPEPTAPVTARGMTFSVADQKGLLSDYHFSDSPLWEYGSTTDALRPADMQRMVLQWVGGQHKGFVIDDFTASDQIESYPVYRFHIVYIPDPLDPNKTHVQLTLWMASYHVDSNFVGSTSYPGPDGQRFDYFIYGPKESPTGGDWEGVSLVGKQGHPRFIWYPDPNVRNIGRTLTSPALSYATILGILGRTQPKPAAFGVNVAHLLAPAGAEEVPWKGW
jgi:hypothetical protein